MAFIQKLGQLRAPVSSYTNLPITGNVLGDVRISTDTGDAYTWMLKASSGILSNWFKVTSSSYNDLTGSPSSSGLDVDNAVKTIQNLAINVAYMSFNMIQWMASSLMRMVDGVVDNFHNENGVSLGNSTNAQYVNYTEPGQDPSQFWFAPDGGELDIYTKLLIHGDGESGSLNFQDLLRNPIINYGVVTNTLIKKFGTGSLSFNGSSYFQMNTPTEFLNLRYTSDFSLDFWFYSLASGLQPIFSSTPEETIKVEKDASNKIHVQVVTGGVTYSILSSTVISNSVWNHIAVQRDNGYLKLYINGTLEATSSGSDVNPIDFATSIIFGKHSTNYLTGNLDEIRFCNGIVKFSSNFTPMTRAYNKSSIPAPTPTIVDISAGNKTVTALGNARMSGNNPLFGNASLYLDGINSYLSLADSNDWKLTDGISNPSDVLDSYTKLLLHLDNNVTDSETTPKTVTNNGVTFSAPGKFGGYAGSFNGSSYLSVPDSSDFYFGTGDFTIDFWMNAISGASLQTIFSQGTGSNRIQLICAEQGGNTFGAAIYVGGASVAYATTNNIPKGSWTHFAFVRSGTTGKCYINGVENTTSGTGWSNSIPDGSGDVHIGNDINSEYGVYNGSLDEFRVSKGIARWTSDFNVPVIPYGADTLTDYTVDLWIDPLSLTDLNTYIIGQDDSWKLTLDGTSNKYLKYTIVGGASVIAPIALTLEAWNHLAIVQKDGVIKLYVNGILGASIAGTAIVNGTHTLSIGATSTGANMFNGFIEEVRISNSARWAAAFTPPSVEYTSDSNTKLLLPLNVQTVPNMVLQSVGYVANYVPTSARVVIFEEDIDVMEPNVDLVVEISRDGGTTFTPCLIAKDQEFGDGTLNLFTGSLDLRGQPNGELLVWKLTTQNNKDCRIRGVSLNWR